MKPWTYTVRIKGFEKVFEGYMKGFPIEKGFLSRSKTFYAKLKGILRKTFSKGVQ